MPSVIDYQNLWRYPGTYRWMSGELVPANSTSTTKSDRVLTTALPMGTYDHAAYKPPPDLFLVFGETALTEESVRSFADQYGLLGLSEQDGGVALALDCPAVDTMPAALPFRGAGKSRPLGCGELLSSWRREISAMRDAINLWSALKQALGAARLSGL
jgi:hypothetical protein